MTVGCASPSGLDVSCLCIYTTTLQPENGRTEGARGCTKAWVSTSQELGRGVPVDDSGFGREGGIYAMRDYLEIKPSHFVPL